MNASRRRTGGPDGAKYMLVRKTLDDDTKIIVPTKTMLVEHAAKAASADSIVDALNAARLQASLASVSNLYFALWPNSQSSKTT